MMRMLSRAPVIAPMYIHCSFSKSSFGPSIIVRANNIDSKDKISGKVEIMSPLVINNKKNFKAKVKSETLENGVTRSIIEFRGTGDGHFSFKPYLHALPIKFRFESDATF